MANFTGSSLNDVLSGSKLSDWVAGLAGNDTLTGLAGADTLDGGAGTDSLVGAAGNDTYVIDNVGDKISETGGDANDRILASINIDLTVNAAAYAGIEHVTLTGSSGLNATGNGSANMLIGNSGANHLDGKAGADTMIGGAGNDVYEVDKTSDKVIEFANGGIDQVNSSDDFTLGANVENLTLTGKSFIEGIGNDLANKITGNTGGNDLFGLGGNDTLIGNDGGDELDGGAGADSMVGGAGNDLYEVDNVGDKVMESGPSTDIDSVSSFITYTLGATLEQLFLQGSANIGGTGNSLNNLINGNNGDNVLSGLGGDDQFNGGGGNDVLLGGDGNDQMFVGPGLDTLLGGAGNDKFVFFQSPNDLNTIADLNGLPGSDTIVFDTDLLSGFVAGVSKVSDFLRTSTANGSTLIQLDADGAANGVAFVDLALLQGVSTDLAGLLANGVLVSGGVVLEATTKALQGGPGADSQPGTGLSDLMLGLAGNDTLTGNVGADTLDGGTGTDSLVGGDGNDTYVVDSAGDKISETGVELDDRILASISIDLLANAVAYAGIEHVTLTGSAALNATGNDSANMLIGNSGANHLDGKVGNDTLIGGAGNDVYEVDSSDKVIELANGGIDQVNSSANFTLGANIENLTLTGTSSISGAGNDLANKITGNAASNGLLGQDGNDTLIGNDGNDALDGGTGADSMAGGKGLDTYTVDNAGDKVTESGPSTDTNDTVQSFITYTLGANLETLTLLGSATIDGTGNNIDNLLVGNSADNVLSGLAGDDLISGELGNDLLLGGDGNDTLRAHIDSDTLIGGAGSDVFEFLSFSVQGLDTIADLKGLPDGDKIDVTSLLVGFVPNVSNVNEFLKTVTVNGNTVIQVDKDGSANGIAFVDMAVLQGVSTDIAGLLANGVLVQGGGLLAPSTAPIQGTAGADNKAGTGISDLMFGLAGNDTLTGNGGADTLDGGTGMDSLVGGLGDDSYVVDSAGDKISEAGGVDRILASISIDLLANAVAYAAIENVTLTGNSALNATGNDFANTLIGNSGANHLDGKGDDDILIGGAGNDVYEVDSVSDKVIEYANGGIDQVNSSDSFTLGDNVENLTLTGFGISGIGNEIANKITGNANDNILVGLDGNDTLIGNDGGDLLIGGTGADSMVGGAGGDSYFVDNVGDKVMESGPSTDFDGVESSITYTLGATLENLTLANSANIDGIGNSLKNNIVGNAGDNILSGLGGDDNLGGQGGNDLLLGGDGNDVLLLQSGQDTAVGGAGSDTFAVRSSVLNGLDVIADFAGGPGGDVIDLEFALGGFDFASDNINDFLKTSTANGNTTIQIDADGTANGVAFVDAVVLEGVSTDLAGLLTNGNLIV